MWVLYAYTNQPVLPTFGIAPRDQFEDWQRGKPADYRLLGYFLDEIQCRTEVANEYLKCSECQTLMPAEAEVEGSCPSCRFYAVNHAAGGGDLGLIAAGAWADAWAERHRALADRWRVVLGSPLP